MSLKRIILILVLMSLVLFLFITQKSSTAFLKIGGQSNNLISPTKTPEFYELTIPYLRQREYKSVLKSIEKVDETDTYSRFDATYQSDGLTIHGMLTIPKGSKPQKGWSAIVFVHGYIPPKQYETFGVSYSKYVDFFAKNEFVVFKIDLRGHGRSEGDPTGAYYSSDYVIDTLNAYAALQASDFVNTNKIGLWGHSMAGNVVMRSFAAKPEIPAVVIWAGAGYTYSDLLKYRIQDTSYSPSQSSTSRSMRREKLRKLYGDPDPEKSFWRELTPVHYLNDLKGAIEIHHANDDTVVSIEYSRDLISLFDKTRVPHEFYEYQTGGHNISDDNFTLAMERSVAFFKKYLKNK